MNDIEDAIKLKNYPLGSNAKTKMSDNTRKQSQHEELISSAVSTSRNRQMADQSALSSENEQRRGGCWMATTPSLFV